MVTGGAGFIGSHVVDGFIAHGHDVVIIDNLSTGKKININPSARFYKIDICNADELEMVFKKEMPDVVNHHAAQVDLRKSMQDPLFDAKVNLIGSLNLIESSKKYKIKGFIYISTGGAVYGEPRYLPVDESHPIQPISQYGVDKHTVEHFLFINKPQGLNYIVLRYPNVYGPRQDPSGEAGVVAIFSIQMLEKQRPTIFGNGAKTRDYVYVSDIVNANIAALSRLDVCDAFNIGWGSEVQDIEIFNRIKSALSTDLEPIYGQKRLGEIERICLKSTKAHDMLNWKPEVNLEKGLRLAAEYYKKLLS